VTRRWVDGTLVKQIKSIRVGAHDTRLFHLLGEISSDEDAAGRGMARCQRTVVSGRMIVMALRTDGHQ